MYVYIDCALILYAVSKYAIENNVYYVKTFCTLIKLLYE